MRETYFYQVYGMLLCVNHPLPGLMATPKRTPVDVFVELIGSRPNEVESVPDALWHTHPDEDVPGGIGYRILTFPTEDGTCYQLRCGTGDEYAGYVIDSTGSRIWVTWGQRAPLESVVSLLLGRVLGYLLRVRGVVCLHASVVAVGGSAVALIGSKGAGKSTIAAALVQRGQPMISDDIAALTHLGTAFLVHPGPSRLSLWPTTISALYGSGCQLPRVLVGSEKRYLDLVSPDTEHAGEFQEFPLPLATIYVLNAPSPDTPVATIEPLPLATGLMTLVAHIYGTLFVSSWPQRSEAFARLGQLATTVPLRQVSRPTGLASLQEVCDTILADFHSRTKIKNNQ